MARIELAPAVLDDFDRFLNPTAEYEVADGAERLREILDAIQILTHSPLIGRPVKGGQREMVIGMKPRGHVALYRYVAAIDTVFLLAVSAQREAGYKR